MAIVAFADPTYTGLVGQHANSEEWNAITRLADDTVANPIGFGQPVYRVTGNDQTVTTDDAGAFLGVTRYRVDIDPVAGYSDGEHVSIMTDGVMYVAAGDDATAGAPAGYDPATDRWADVAGDYVEVPGVEFDTTAGAGAIVKIRIKKTSAVTPAVGG